MLIEALGHILVRLFICEPTWRSMGNLYPDLDGLWRPFQCHPSQLLSALTTFLLTWSGLTQFVEWVGDHFGTHRRHPSVELSGKMMHFMT